MTPSEPTGPFPRRAWRAWLTGSTVALSVVYLVLSVTVVRPYLAPAGRHGLEIAADPLYVGTTAETRKIVARVPHIDPSATSATVARVARGSAAERAGVRAGDRLGRIFAGAADGPAVNDLTRLDADDGGGELDAWRAAYRQGLRGTLTFEIRQGRVARAELPRPAVWDVDAGTRRRWLQQHGGMILQIVAFAGGAAALLLLRATDTTATLAALALALCAVSGGGPLWGTERALPPVLAEAMTFFTWIATPFAFPITGLAILYFPSASRLVTRHRWILALPFIAAGPMIALGTGTALYLIGVDALRPLVLWDGQHPGLYFTSFTAALAFNVWTIVDGLRRFRAVSDQNQRRRIRLVVALTVPGVLAYAIKDGLPVATTLATGAPVDLPWWATAILQVIVVLPAFGLTYAVAVHRVLGPRVVLRRSLQYALARSTLTILTILPAAALAVALFRRRDMTLSMIATGAGPFYLALIAFALAGLKYRERARRWLDRRFFRQEYDAREILLSLAGRVRFETDPSDLASLVVQRIDEALHPTLTAILVSGIDEGVLTPVAVLHGSAETLPLSGGLVTMLRWSDEPLELDLTDQRSPARRLPADDIEWLECTGATLIVPVIGDDRGLMGLIVLGPKRSEEPYTSEDRQLLASIASQVGLGFDVARLRRRLSAGAASDAPTSLVPGDAGSAMAECPRCGRCDDASVDVCPADGTRMSAARNVPRVVDNKYRLDQLLGRGGMGAVYRARDVRLDRDVALKVVRSDLLGNAEARSRFRREAQVVARLQHPAIVAIFDYGTLPDGGAYLVMEMVRGEDLRCVLRREVRLPPERALRVLAGVCAGIHAAHRESVLHRDLKPENVLVTGGDAEVKILDFGIAKLLDPPEAKAPAGALVTVEGSVLGTPAYMAPEQIRGPGVDPRTDVFSLAVIFYEMVTGVLPFGLGSLGEIAVRQVEGAAPPSARWPTLGTAFDRIILAALDLDPARRPPSALELATQLQSAADDR
jgi:tRNA A-37 threonylcarbamoyl transferase component Bud32